MIRVLQEDIIMLRDVEAICVANNGMGICSKGSSAALNEILEGVMEVEARKFCSSQRYRVMEGGCFKTSPGKFDKHGIKAIYHAVTTSYVGGPSSLHSISQAFKKVMETALKDEIKSLAVCGLGTGSAAMDKESVARIMVQIAENYSHRIDVFICDLDKDFVNEVKKFIKTEQK